MANRYVIGVSALAFLLIAACDGSGGADSGASGISATVDGSVAVTVQENIHSVVPTPIEPTPDVISPPIQDSTPTVQDMKEYSGDETSPVSDQSVDSDSTEESGRDSYTTLVVGQDRALTAPVKWMVPVYDLSLDRLIEIRIDQVFRGVSAAQIVRDTNEIDLDPPLGKEFLLTQITVKYVHARGDEKKHFDRFTMDLVSGTGHMITSTLPVGLDPPKPHFVGTGYPGSQVSGWILWVVPVHEGDLVLRYAPYIYESKAAWLSTAVPSKVSANVKAFEDADNWEAGILCFVPGQCDDEHGYHAHPGALYRFTFGGISVPFGRSSQEPFRYGMNEANACLDSWADHIRHFVERQIRGNDVMLELVSGDATWNWGGSSEVFVYRDSVDLGASLVGMGYAQVDLPENHPMAEEYDRLQTAAMISSQGIWSCWSGETEGGALTDLDTSWAPKTVQLFNASSKLDGTSRLYSAPIGSEVTVTDSRGEWAVGIKILKVLRGVPALAVVEATLQDSDLAFGTEYLLTYVEVEFRMSPDEEGKNFDKYMFELVSDQGILISDARVSTLEAPDPRFGGGGYPGANFGGWLLWQIPQDMGGIVMRFSPFLIYMPEGKSFDSLAAWLKVT